MFATSKMPLTIFCLVVLHEAIATEDEAATELTCGVVKDMYRTAGCCGQPTKELGHQIIPNPKERLSGSNPCDGQKAITQPTMDNFNCSDAILEAFEQAGADVSEGYMGEMSADGTKPITDPFYKTALCPVNVHWHLGAEHRSEGEYDEDGKSPELAGEPAKTNVNDAKRRLGEGARYGFACNLYTEDDAMYNTEYEWKYCKNMHVGETYEVHWPSSALGACGTPNQYQTPFYDGVFCHATAEMLGNLSEQDVASSVGVQAQVFTIVNDEKYYYPDLIRGMIVDSDNAMGQNVATYTGSTTGTTRNNQICSAYTPITWQVDRKCHRISASSFDKMCADMLQMRDDMSMDLEPHGARELVLSSLAADNLEDAKVGR